MGKEHDFRAEDKLDQLGLVTQTWCASPLQLCCCFRSACTFPQLSAAIIAAVRVFTPDCPARRRKFSDTVTVHRHSQPSYTAPSTRSDVSLLFQPLSFGQARLQNRIVYAPLTRCRATGNVPQDNAIEYYTQRARGCEGGLIITEATVISEDGRG